MARKTFTRLICISLLSGGFCFGAAPIASVNVSTNTVEVVTPAPAIAIDPGATPPPATASNNAPQVVDSQALLASLTPDQRIARLENQVQYLSTATDQIQSLNAQVSVLRGQMEEVTHQMTLLQKQIAAPASNSLTTATAIAPVMATATATTLATAASTATTASATSTAPTVNPQEQVAFNKAYTLLTQKQYDEATTAFNGFLKQYPKSTLAPDAHFWLGDLYLAEGQPDNASQEYRAVISTQNAVKRPDAMVKLGTILLAYGDNANAKKLFQSVIAKYPNTPAATQAQTRLTGISVS